MAIIKWEPFGELDRLFGEMPEFPRLSKFDMDLAVDLYEKDDAVVAEMNLPGIDPDKIDVSVEGNYLRVSGSREETKEEKKKHYYSKEIRRGAFERVVRLPVSVQTGKVKAEYEGGMLRVTMPKEALGKAGRVKVAVKK